MSATRLSLSRHPQPPGRAGFTLIELLVVMVILGVLAAFIIPRVVGRGEDARRAKGVSDIEALGTALDIYANDNGKYPTTEQGLEALRTRPTTPPLPRAWNGPYLRKALTPDAWGNPYIYRSPGEHNPHSYDLSSLGADGRAGGTGNDQDINNWE